MKILKYLTIITLLFCSNITFAQKGKTYTKYKHSYRRNQSGTKSNVSQGLDRSKLPEAGPAPIIKIGKAENFTLPNGLKVYVVTNSKLPRVAFNLVLDREPLVEGEYAGLTKAVGDLLSTGTKNRTKDEFDEETDFIGASINTSSTGVFASSLKKHSEKLLELMSDVVLNPSFTQIELDKIKKQMKSNLASEKDDPNVIANKVSQVLLFGKDHAYGEQITNVSVEKLNLDVCNKYYNTYFRPNIGYLAVVGDITIAEAKLLIEKYFANWEKAEVPRTLTSFTRTIDKTKVILVDRPSSVQSVISIVNTANLKIGSPDVIKARITNDILGGNESRLFNNLREKHGFTYGAYSALTSDRIIGKFYAGASVRNAVTDSSIAEMLSELNSIKSTKPAEDELNRTKNAITGSFVFSLERPQTVADFAINTARYNMPGDYYSNYLKNVEATSADDVQYIAQTYIKPENCYIVVVGKASEIAEKLKKFGEIEYYDAEGNKVEAPSPPKPAPIGITVENILDKYINAIGGKSKIASVVDLEMNYSGNIPNGPAIVTTITKKSPNKSMQEVKVMGNVMQKTVIDGTKAITSARGQESELKDWELKQAIAKGTIFYEQNPAQAGLKAILRGVEKIEGKDCNKVEYSIGDAKWTEYFDVSTGLKARSIESRKTANGELTTTVDYIDYKETDGVKFPAIIKQNMGQVQIELKLDSVKINKGIDDKLFIFK